MLLARSRDEPTGVSAKSSRTDLVSDADRAAEDAVVGALHRDFPDDEIVAEEGSLVHGTSGRTWYVDPLDGTINYLYRIPHWCVAIACDDPQGTLLAVVFDPIRQEVFYGERGIGSWSDAQANLDAHTPSAAPSLAVTGCGELSQALVATGFAYLTEARLEQARILNGVLPGVRDIRRFGSAQLDLAWTAAGRFDAYFESVDKPWDWKAGALLVREAGGRVSQLAQARPGQPHIVASAPRIHEPLVTLLRGAVQSG
jgi:myo-inositol-1(or 4)-monophosphatase